MVKIIFLKLIVDIGNTRIKLALFKGKEIIRTTIVEEFTRESIDKFCKKDNFVSSIISSVRPFQEKEKELINLLESLVLDKDSLLPIISNYKSFVGSDRISAVVGASCLFPNKDILVFDSGTCLTMDFINKEKTYQGGRITLGLDMRYKALHEFTSKLPMLSNKRRVCL